MLFVSFAHAQYKKDFCTVLFFIPTILTVSSELLSGLSRMAAAGCSFPTVRAYTGENFSITLSPIRNIESSKKDIFGPAPPVH